MKEIPIIFSTDMVKAILERRKTQTRRVIKPQPSFLWNKVCPVENTQGIVISWCFYESTDYNHENQGKCPYGGGDRLWVRETHAWVTLGEKDPWKDRAIADGTFRRTNNGEPVKMYYRTDGEIPASWRPSIHMFKWAARIWLEIVSVRPERLQEITEEDAVAEGIKPAEHAFHIIADGDVEVETSPIEQFAELWDSLNAWRGYSWNMNPWVWRIEFAIRG